MTRVCARGHLVAEDGLRTCPHCGGTLPPTGVRPARLAPEPVAVDVPRTVPFLIGAVVLAAFGTLLAYAARHGVAAAFGWVLIAAAVGLGALGVVDAYRRR